MKICSTRAGNPLGAETLVRTLSVQITTNQLRKEFTCLLTSKELKWIIIARETMLNLPFRLGKNEWRAANKEHLPFSLFMSLAVAYPLRLQVTGKTADVG